MIRCIPFPTHPVRTSSLCSSTTSHRHASLTIANLWTLGDVGADRSRPESNHNPTEIRQWSDRTRSSDGSRPDSDQNPVGIWPIYGRKLIGLRSNSSQITIGIQPNCGRRRRDCWWSQIGRIPTIIRLESGLDPAKVGVRPDRGRNLTVSRRCQAVGRACSRQGGHAGGGASARAAVSGAGAGAHKSRTLRNAV